MNIYFAGSIAGGMSDTAIYHAFISHLSQHGRVLTEHVGDEQLIAIDKQRDPRVVHDRDLAWLLSADVVVADVTQPSLGVGYELAHAVHYKKRTLCLWRPQDGRKLSFMIVGSPDLTVKVYHTVDEGKKHIDEFFIPLKTSV